MALAARSSVTLGTDVVLRAVGVSLVVVDHATSVTVPAEILAGLNILLIVSGFSLGRAMPAHPSAAAMRATLLRYAKALALPCFAALVASAVIYQRLSVPDLLFIGNWFGGSHVAFFPAWYPMELVQYILLMIVFVSLPFFARTYRWFPWAAIATMLIFAVLLRLVLSYLWKHGLLEAGGPHVMFWNLVAGWLLFASLYTRRGGTLPWLSFAVVAALAFFTWGPFLMRTWTTLGAGLALILLSKVALPFVAGIVVSLVSQAALTIYIFHQPAIGVVNRLTGTTDTVASGLVAILACTMLWILATATLRTYRLLATGEASQEPAQVQDATASFGHR